MTQDDIIHARVGRNGVLLEADAALAHLQERAGGHVPGPVISPQLANAIALAFEHDAPVMRQVYGGEEEFDLRFWARIRPDEEGADIEISGWTEEAKLRPSPLDEYDFPLDAPGWTFECDENLAIVGLWAEGAAARIRTRDWIGRSLDELFELPSDQDTVDIHSLVSAEASLSNLPVDAMVDGVAARAELSIQARRNAEGEITSAVGALKLVRGETDIPMKDKVYLPGNWGALDRRMDEALRLPIGRIIANAETIARKVDGDISDDYANYAGDIASAGKHLLGLIDDLADLQAIEREGFEVASERVDIAKVARQAAGLLSMRANQKQMIINVVDPDNPIAATGEFRRVLQILINFVSNAVRYAPDASTVTITAQAETGEEAVRVTVDDEGPGISHGDRARIFDKFERLGRRDHGGSGLGLYIANRLAKVMGGRIDIDSEPGEGARFSLLLPRWPD